MKFATPSKWYERKRINWENGSRKKFLGDWADPRLLDMSTRTLRELPCTNSLMASSTGYPVTRCSDFCNARQAKLETVEKSLDE